MKHQKLVRLFALTLPLIGAIASAQAQSDYRYNDGTYNNGGVYGNGTYGNGGVYGNGNTAGFTRLRGTVERVYSSRSFDLRTQDGQIVRVKSDSDLNLRIGDTTTVRGELRGKTFYAERINRRDDNLPGNGNGAQRVELRGEVIAVDGRRTLRVQDSDDGRILRVQLQSNLNSRISRGDLVLIRGTFDGSLLRADAGQVQLLSDDNRVDGNYGNNGNGYGNGNNGDVYGNGNNGNGYGYGHGRGNNGNGNGYGRGNNRPGDNGYRPSDGIGYGAYGDNVLGRTVNFPATVSVVRRGEVEVRGDNGRTYIVRLNSNRINARIGDRVRVNGIARDGFIEATQLNRTN